MRTGVYGAALFCCAMLFAAGCAKEHVVVKQEPTETKPAPPAKPEPTPPAPAPTPAPTPAPPVEAVPEKTPSGPTPGEAGAQTEKGREEARRALEAVYFDYDSAALSDAARNRINANFDIIRKSGARVQIEGHCDERGSDEYNLALGERRAASVKSYLVNLGIKPDHLTTISYGKEKPVDPAHTEEAWAKNRRAEFIIVK